jgi:hypothetical protein
MRTVRKLGNSIGVIKVTGGQIKDELTWKVGARRKFIG